MALFVQSFFLSVSFLFFFSVLCLLLFICLFVCLFFSHSLFCAFLLYFTVVLLFSIWCTLFRTLSLVCCWFFFSLHVCKVSVSVCACERVLCQTLCTFFFVHSIDLLLFVIRLLLCKWVCIFFLLFCCYCLLLPPSKSKLLSRS